MLNKLLAKIPFKKTIVTGLSALVLGLSGCNNYSKQEDHSEYLKHEHQLSRFQYYSRQILAEEIALRDNYSESFLRLRPCTTIFKSEVLNLESMKEEQKFYVYDACQNRSIDEF